MSRQNIKNKVQEWQKRARVAGKIISYKAKEVVILLCMLNGDGLILPKESQNKKEEIIFCFIYTRWTLLLNNNDNEWTKYKK